LYNCFFIYFGGNKISLQKNLSNNLRINYKTAQLLLFIHSQKYILMKNVFLKKLIEKCTLTFAITLLCIGYLNAQVSVKSESTFYGYCFYGASGTTGPVKFLLSNPQAITTIRNDNTYFAHAGEYANGKWYAYMYNIVGGSTTPYSFAIINTETGVFQNQSLTTGAGILIDKDMVADMTYRYKDNTMYAMKNTPTGPVLTKVNITGTGLGVHTVVGTITGGTTKYAALACHLNGDMYAIGDDAKLYKINIGTLSASLIGNTGIAISTLQYLQSMTFDHNTNTLYWACENGQFYSVNTTTGTATSLGNTGSSSINSLFTKFENVNEGVPGIVGSLTATPGANGSVSLSLQWKNPEQTAQGSTLTSITAIKIYRDNTLYQTYTTNLTPGATINWTDASALSGSHTYKAIPENANGIGVPASVTLFIGTDIPKPVKNLVLSNDGANHPLLTWTAPTEGVNNGWIGNLTYDIVRNPGNVAVASNVASTTYTDLTNLELNSYTYSVSAKNTQGIGASLSSNAMVFGNALTIPWREDFDNVNNFVLWTVINANQDGNTWSRTAFNGKTTAPSVSCPSSYTESDDDWLISPPIALEANKTYLLRWADRNYSSSFTVKYDVTMGASNTVESQSVVLGQYILDKVSGFHDQEIFIPAQPTAGNYYFAWHCTTEKNNYTLILDDIEIIRPKDTDAKLVSFSGSKALSVGTEQTFIASVQNYGNNPLTAFTITLRNESNNTLVTVPYEGTIASGQIVDIPVNWTPASSTEGEHTITATINLNGDEDTANNSKSLNVTIYPFGKITSKIGDVE
jgi:hypothetical protein